MIDRLTADMLERKSARRRADVEALLRLWAAVGGVDDDAMDTWTQTATAAHEAELAASIIEQASYGAAWSFARNLDRPANDVDPDQVLAELRLGVTIEDTMRRPVEQARTDLSRGSEFTAAMRRSADRLRSVAETNHQLAHQLTAKQIWTDTSASKYRRVLQGPVNCGLCIAASSRAYNTGSLMPIHPSCDCGVAPIVDRRDLSDAKANYEDLVRELQANDIKAYSRSELANVRIDASELDRLRAGVDVVEHGEMGPLLTYRQHKTSGPPAAWKRRNRREYLPGGHQIRGRPPPPGETSPLLDPAPSATDDA